MAEWLKCVMSSWSVTLFAHFAVVTDMFRSRFQPTRRRPYLLVLPDCGLSYPAAEHVRELILEAAWATAAPSEYEMTATSIGQAATPPMPEASESNAAVEKEPYGVTLGENAPRSNAHLRYLHVGVNKDDEAAIPFVDDINTDEEQEPTKRSNGYHPSKSPRQKRTSLITNGSCEGACHLQLPPEDDVVIREASSSSELRNRRCEVTSATAERKNVPLPVMLNCRNIRFTDFTAAKVKHI